MSRQQERGDRHGIPRSRCIADARSSQERKKHEMFNHVVVGPNDLEKAKQFYAAVLGVLGAGEGRKDDNERRRRYVYRTGTGTFFVTQPIDGQAASPANGGTIGF